MTDNTPSQIDEHNDNAPVPLSEKRPAIISAIHSVLGDAFYTLPLEVQRGHDHEGHLRLTGHADVKREPGFINAIICWLAGLPDSGFGQRVTFDFYYDENGVEHWWRNINGRVYRSTMHVGEGEYAGKLIERHPLWTSVFDLEAKSDRLSWKTSGFSIFGKVLSPDTALHCEVSESGYDGRFRFDITMELPYFGRLIAYRGEIAPPSRTFFTPEEQTSFEKPSCCDVLSEGLSNET